MHLSQQDSVQVQLHSQITLVIRQPHEDVQEQKLVNWSECRIVEREISHHRSSIDIPRYFYISSMHCVYRRSLV